MLSPFYFVGLFVLLKKFCNDCRWCRTYFLHKGKSLEYISLGDRESGAGTAGTSLSPEITLCAERLEAIYGKLVIGLRAAVKIAFSNHTDVLEAGTFVQVTIYYLQFR